MYTDRHRFAAGVLLAVCFLVPSIVHAQTFALDPVSASLAIVPATSSDLLTPAPGLPAPGPVPPPMVASTAASIGLLPGDVIDALTFGNDTLGTLYFTVDRASVGVAAAPPDVASEVTAVPPGFQPEASSDIFATADPASGTPPGFNTQVLDGDGMPISPLVSYGGFGLGLSEVLALPGPPLVDQIADFDWSAPGWGTFTCWIFSLAPGSPTLTPGSNPLLPAGAEPADILASCPGFTPFVFIFAPVAGSGLISGGPGCAPPACDDVDALISFPVYVSLAPGSPSLAALPATVADVIDHATGAVVIAGASLGLAPGDDVKGLETIANPCPAFPFSGPDGPDGDGIAAACPDNCPGTFNPTQEDLDFDGTGDACDACTDTDADGLGNPGFSANVCPTDLCPFTPGPNGDGDGDGVGDICDNCPATANPTQADGDFDSIGDACDTCTDIDGDGFGISGDVCGTDNCPTTANPAQTDTDADTVGDDCDNCALVANLAQTDTDADTVGDACDNCQADSNVAQADGDLDGAGDACDICTAGVAVTKPGLLFKKIGAGAGLEGIQVKGTAAFAGAVPIPPVDVTTLGMRVEVTDLGNAGNVVVDHTIPAGLVPNACGPKDGWKQNTPGTSESFSTITDSIPPGCVAGSSQGITKAKSLDKTSVLKGVKHKLSGKTGTFSPLTGPFRVVVVYGGGAEEAAGQCSETTYLPAQCVLNGSGTTLKCKQ